MLELFKADRSGSIYVNLYRHLSLEAHRILAPQVNKYSAQYIPFIVDEVTVVRASKYPLHVIILNYSRTKKFIEVSVG